MIKISINAQEYISRLLSKKKMNTHIKIFVNNPGTEKASCGIEYIYFKNITSMDKKFKFNNFNVYIKKEDIPFLKKSKIKLVKNNLNFELMLHSPYIRSFKKKRSDLENKILFFIEININPFLLSHGGKLFLKEINKKKEIMIEFQGGCNGCSMVNSTLKNMVEKRLLNNFPQISKVIDVTLHKPNSFSYY
ncbi:Fe/S biogenesis protein NfuA [Buchnera aphidicola (Periphyllus testudinaceus)]|uniref:NifU family protein n=1 Tax=Buchnera aphidicola TaxID=9 RepID=UPI003464657E